MPTRAQKRAASFRMVASRQDDKEFHRQMGEWWDSSAEAWGSRWRPAVREITSLHTPLHFTPHPTSLHTHGVALYFLSDPEDGKVLQANLYTKGNCGTPAR